MISLFIDPEASFSTPLGPIELLMLLALFGLALLYFLFEMSI
jgi:hypothetical protein